MYSVVTVIFECGLTLSSAAPSKRLSEDPEKMVSSRGEYVALSPRLLEEFRSGVDPLPAQMKLLCEVTLRGSGIGGRPCTKVWTCCTGTVINCRTVTAADARFFYHWKCKGSFSFYSRVLKSTFRR